MRLIFKSPTSLKVLCYHIHLCIYQMLSYLFLITLLHLYNYKLYYTYLQVITSPLAYTLFVDVLLPRHDLLLQSSSEAMGHSQ